ncbi:MAG: hypothetical protein ACRCXB_27715 [Aeromonadaceae bacterium]
MVRYPKRRLSRQRHLWFAVWNSDGVFPDLQAENELPAKVSSR